MNVHILTNAYCNANVFRAGVNMLHATVNMSNKRHVVLFQHYPIGTQDLLNELMHYENADVLRGEKVILDAGRNLGLHEGLNYMLSKLELSDDDVIVAFDPDENPLKYGWLDAMIRVMEADRKVGWLSLMNPPCRAHLDSLGCKPEVIGGERVQFPGHALMNCVVAWRYEALRKVGKLTEPHAYYGGIEGAMQPKFMDAGYRIGWMTDYDVAPLHDLADPEYTLYKSHHVGFRQPEYPGSFDEWLASRKA